MELGARPRATSLKATHLRLVSFPAIVSEAERFWSGFGKNKCNSCKPSYCPTGLSTGRLHQLPRVRRQQQVLADSLPWGETEGRVKPRQRSGVRQTCRRGLFSPADFELYPCFSLLSTFSSFFSFLFSSCPYMKEPFSGKSLCGLFCK